MAKRVEENAQGSAVLAPLHDSFETSSRRRSLGSSGSSLTRAQAVSSKLWPKDQSSGGVRAAPVASKPPSYLNATDVAAPSNTMPAWPLITPISRCLRHPEPDRVI